MKDNTGCDEYLWLGYRFLAAQGKEVPFSPGQEDVGVIFFRFQPTLRLGLNTVSIRLSVLFILFSYAHRLPPLLS